MMLGWGYFWVKSGDKDLRHKPIVDTVRNSLSGLLDTAHATVIDSPMFHNMSFYGIPIYSWQMSYCFLQFPDTNTTIIHIVDSGRITLSYNGHTVIFTK